MQTDTQTTPRARFLALLMFITVSSLLLAVEPIQQQAGPVVRATVLRANREKSIGLGVQLAALHPIRGRFIVTTNATDTAAADFELRFSWRTSKGAQSSNDAPSMVAADVEPARKALLAAMTDSYVETSMARVTVEAPANGRAKCWEVIFPLPHTGASLARQYRVARRLVATRLVELHMLSASDGTWPAKLRPTKLLALYDADGAGYGGSTALDHVVAETTLDAQTVPVCGEDIREGILDCCSGVLIPGGSGGAIATALHPDGVKRLRDFVANGGGYFGVCAGAYLASSGVSAYTGMVPLKHHHPSEKGKAKLELSLTPAGVALLGKEFLHIETAYHNGPVFADLAPRGQRAPVTVLANFESPSTDANGVVRNEMVGTPAILSMQWQKGRIMIISPHPETNAKFYPLVARAIGWTIGQDPTSVHAGKLH